MKKLMNYAEVTFADIRETYIDCTIEEVQELVKERSAANENGHYEWRAIFYENGEPTWFVLSNGDKMEW